MHTHGSGRQQSCTQTESEQQENTRRVSRRSNIFFVCSFPIWAFPMQPGAALKIRVNDTEQPVREPKAEMPTAHALQKNKDFRGVGRGSSITQSQLSMQQVLSLKLNNTWAHACTHTYTLIHPQKMHFLLLNASIFYFRCFSKKVNFLGYGQIAQFPLNFKSNRRLIEQLAFHLKQLECLGKHSQESRPYCC